MKNIVCWIFLLILSISASAQSVVINEVVYANKTGLTDFTGHTPDWIELFNRSGHHVDLSAYQLTDDTSKTAYWSFPPVTLAPGEYLIVFASDLDTIVNNELHASFKLGVLKETLFLIDDDHEIIDEINPVCVPEDRSYARIPDGSENLFVTLPTPGGTNNQSLPETVNFISDSISVDIPGGIYSNPVNVHLTNNHPENIIHYTLNGNVPDGKSPVYDEGILLSDLTSSENRFANIPETIEPPGNKIFKANILRAVVYSNGCPASNGISATYFINDKIKGQYPVHIVSLITDKDNLFDDETGIYVHGEYLNYEQHGNKWQRDVHIEIYDSAGIKVIDQDGGLRIHGRGSRKSPQKSLRIYADREYGNEYFNYPLFSRKPEIDKYKVLLLRTTGGTLGPLFKEELCNYLVSGTHVDFPACETAILFINGEYWGIYNLMERQNKYYIENNYGVENTNIDIIAYDRKVVVEEGSADEYNRLLDMIKNADPSSDSFFDQFDRLIDFDNLIDYFTAQLYFANMDWPQSNLELWKFRNDTAKWRYFFFDSDAGMQWVNYDHLTEYNNDHDDFQRFEDYAVIILKTLMNNEQFRKLFYSRFYYLLSTTFSTENVMSAINHYESIYAPLVPEHIYRWHNPVEYRKWEENVDWLKSFAIQRPLILAEQLQRNFGDPWTIYPNPCRGSFTIEFISPVSNCDIRIYSTSGLLLREWKKYNRNSCTFSCNTDLPAGLYIVKGSAGTCVFTGKLIVQ